MSTNAVERTTPAPPPAPARRRGPRRLRRWQAAVLVAGLVVGAVALSGRFGSEPLRRSMEARMNRSLHGYTVRIGKLKLQPIGGALTLEGLEIRQTAHPEPPLAVIPSLRASVEWRQVFFLRLVADFVIDRPSVSMNLPQLTEEVANAVPVKQRGWQQAFEAIYPLKINLLRVDDGTVVYVDNASDRPLRVTHLNVRASNIRNIHSRNRAYPSPIEASAFIFGSGKASLAGQADFLAEPHLGVQGEFRVADVPLDDLRPLGSHWNIETHAGTLTANGEVEYAPTIRRLRVPSVVLRGVRVDYIRRSPKASPDALRGAAAQSPKDPEKSRAWDLALDRLQMVDANIGFRNDALEPAYRVYIDGATLDVRGFSSRSSSQPAAADLKGKFMDSGAARGHVRFWSADGGTDADLDLSIEGTNMRKMNDVFRAHGKFDVFAGTFSLFSQIHLRGREVDGYVKPLFQNIEIYDSRQDARKGIFRQVYESAVDAAAKLLTNPKHKQVATTVELHGSVTGPKSSTLQIVFGLIENAFFKAILPGFDLQVGTPKR